MDLFGQALPTPVGVGLGVLLGLIVGSFLNALIHRLPRRMEAELTSMCAEQAGQEPTAAASPHRWFGLAYLMSPPSSCPACGHRIKPLENIPIVSWLILKGRCSNCGTRISLQYPLVELASGVLSGLIVLHFGAGWSALALLLLTWGLLAMSVIDVHHHLLPDVLVLPLLWLGILFNLSGHGLTDIHSALIGATAGYLSLWFLFHLFLLLTGKEGMGYGDFKLFALFGAWLGWQYLPQILLLSTIVGAMVGISLILIRGRDRNLPIPFGPYLAAAGWIALLWGEQINRSYLQMMRFG